MITVTEGVAFSTALTNILIALVAMFGIALLEENKLWKQFFTLLLMVGFLGMIVHGIVMSKTLELILWIILAILITMTISTAFRLFTNCSKRRSTIITLIISIVLILELLFRPSWVVPTFVTYALVVVLITLYSLIKDGIWKNIGMFIGFIVLLLSAIVMYFKISCCSLNHDGLGHVLLVVGLIILLISIKKEKL